MSNKQTLDEVRAEMPVFTSFAITEGKFMLIKSIDGLTVGVNIVEYVNALNDLIFDMADTLKSYEERLDALETPANG